MALQFNKYKVEGVGKLLKDTKKKHSWLFTADNEQYLVETWDSMVSHKLRVKIQNKQVFDCKVTPQLKKEGLEFQFKDVALKIKKKSDNHFDLIVNHQKFELTKKIKKEPIKPTQSLNFVRETKKKEEPVDKTKIKKAKTAKKQKPKGNPFDDLVMFEDKKEKSDDEDFINFNDFNATESKNTDFHDFGFDDFDFNKHGDEGQTNKNQQAPVSKPEAKPADDLNNDFLNFDLSDHEQVEEEKVSEESVSEDKAPVENSYQSRNNPYDIYFSAQNDSETKPKTQYDQGCGEYENITSAHVEKTKKTHNFNFDTKKTKTAVANNQQRKMMNMESENEVETKSDPVFMKEQQSSQETPVNEPKAENGDGFLEFGLDDDDFALEPVEQKKPVLTENKGFKNSEPEAKVLGFDEFDAFNGFSNKPITQQQPQNTKAKENNAFGDFMF